MRMSVLKAKKAWPPRAVRLVRVSLYYMNSQKHVSDTDNE
jgi:hypothetical protein